MAKRLGVISQLRPKIISQGVVGLEKMAGRMAKNTTFHEDEIYGILRLYVRETIVALQAGETVKIDGLLTVAPNMKVGGAVAMSIRGNRKAATALDNPRLWTADKVANHANVTKSTAELIDQWNRSHPDDPVTD